MSKKAKEFFKKITTKENLAKNAVKRLNNIPKFFQHLIDIHDDILLEFLPVRLIFLNTISNLIAIKNIFYEVELAEYFDYL